jgi:predicted metalloprotease with PDZ domain
VLALALVFAAQSAGHPISLFVDAREAARGVVFVTEEIPVEPGTVALQYPKWMPGAHSPVGGQSGIIDFKVDAGDKTLPWERDLVEMNTVRVHVPPGFSSIRVRCTLGNRVASTKMGRISWFQLVWYPAQPIKEVFYSPSVQLPAGWKLASALPLQSANGSRFEFKTVSLHRLVDSPCLIGERFKEFDVTGKSSVPHYLDVMADTEAGLSPSPEVLDHVRRIHEETEAIMGSHHYRDYHWLLTISDFAPRAGLEHHESSEDGAGSKGFTDEALDLADLLSHEYFHSFNGKFRRPIGLCTPDYQKPMKDDLLWVYEGLTQFMGQLLACRAGWWTPEQWREQIALNYDSMNMTKGRKWRTLEDTASGLTSNGSRPATWYSGRRGGDYYVESTIVWLNVDMRIRQLTNGQKSLMDFLRLFEGGAANWPELKPYDLPEVVATLNRVAPFDWAKLLKERVYELQPELSQEGFQLAGWKLVYTDTPNAMEGKVESGGMGVNLASSIGLNVSAIGSVQDVIPESPADAALMCPGMTIKSVDGEAYSAARLIEAVKVGSAANPIKLHVAIQDSERDVTIAYSGGLRYPHLVRNLDQPDRLTALLTPLAR